MPDIVNTRPAPFVRFVLGALIVASAACARSAGSQRDSVTAGQPDTLNFPAPDRPTSRIVAPRWIVEDERDKLGEASRVISFAGVKEGMTVADIGAGDGYYVARLSPIVGAAGKVIGEDIMPNCVQMLRDRIAADKLANVVAITGTPSDPQLAPKSVDVAFMIHMYHEITRPFDLLWNLSTALKPAGTLVIVDQNGPTDRHGTPPVLLRCELELVGYEQTDRTTLDDGAYAVLFRAPALPVAPDIVRQRLASGACKQN